jgi:hypothetical protein
VEARERRVLVGEARWLERARCESDRLVTVSTRPSSSSLGGATGTSAKKRKPIRPR